MIGNVRNLGAALAFGVELALLPGSDARWMVAARILGSALHGAMLRFAGS